MSTPPGKPPRPVPQRTCLGCRQEQGKRQLIRIVRTPAMRIIVDPTGRANGRGAYIHPSRHCWEKALKGSTIGHALRFIPAREDVEALRAYGMTLPAEEAASP